MHKIILSIGSNYNMVGNISKAKKLISNEFTNVVFTNSLLTEPYGNSDIHTENYINLLVYVTTYMQLEDLSKVIKEIEYKCGDTRQLRTEGKVAMDIDLLLYDNTHYHVKDWERDYVIKLLKELQSFI